MLSKTIVKLPKSHSFKSTLTLICTTISFLKRIKLTVTYHHAIATTRQSFWFSLFRRAKLQISCFRQKWLVIEKAIGFSEELKINKRNEN